MRDTEFRQETDQLIQVYVEGTLNESEAARLLKLLKERPELGDQLQNDFALDAMLRDLSSDSRMGTTALSNSLSEEKHDRVAWRRWLALAALLILTVTPVAYFWSQSVTYVASVQGSVTVFRNQQQFAAVANFPLTAGDRIQCSEDGIAEIRNRNEATRFRLSRFGDLIVNQLGKGTCLELRRGDLEAVVATQRVGNSVQVATQQASIEVVGTRFVTTADSGFTRVVVGEGSVKMHSRLERDLSPIEVKEHEYAVAAPGAVFQPRHSADSNDRSSVPLKVSAKKEMFTGFGSWLPDGNGVRQLEVARIPNERSRPDGTIDRDKANLHSFYYVPLATSGSVRLRANVDIHETTNETIRDGELHIWRAGLGLRFPEHEVSLHLHVRNEVVQSPQATLRTRCLLPTWNRFIQIPLDGISDKKLAKLPSNSFHLLWEVHRKSPTSLELRGKIWSMEESEPIDWLVISYTGVVDGPISAVTFETFRAACTFRDFQAELLLQ